MKFTQHQQHETDVNITPLIDIVFLLLIFFMVSTSFQKDSALHVQLPEAESDVPERLVDPIEVVVGPDGQYFINNQELINNKMQTLRAALARVSGQQTDIPLIIRADGRSPHQSVVTVMDVASQIGFQRLSIATSKINPK